MRAALIREPVNCGVFRSFVCHFQAGELAEADRALLHDHLDRCPPCARYLEFENAFKQTLQSRIPRRCPPDGLESRVRSALFEDAAGAPAHERRAGRRLVWGLLAAAVLAVVVAPWLLTRKGAADPLAPVHVVRPAMLVDEDCDRAGIDVDAQRACRTASHLNALKLEDGTYWSLSVEDPMARSLVADASQRGRRFVVEGDYYPGIRTLHLTRMPDAQLSRGTPVPAGTGSVAALR